MGNQVGRVIFSQFYGESRLLPELLVDKLRSESSLENDRTMWELLPLVLAGPSFCLIRIIPHRKLSVALLSFY